MNALRSFWREFRANSPTARWLRLNRPPPDRHPIRSVAARRCYDEDVISGDYEYVPAKERTARRERRYRLGWKLQTVAFFVAPISLVLLLFVGLGAVWLAPFYFLAIQVCGQLLSLSRAWRRADDDLYVLEKGPRGPRRVLRKESAAPWWFDPE